jgi:FkbM family methyltransferase
MNLKEFLSFYLLPLYLPLRHIEKINDRIGNKIKFDEVTLVLNYIHKTKSAGTMFDVGAQYGESFAPFAYLGWNIFAFEPDNNPQKQNALSKYKSNPKVKISSEAVSDSEKQDVPFFASNESTGISSLAAFTNGHKEIARTNVTTLSRFVDKNSVHRIDFLKIDIEGYDFMAIKGFPWGIITPDFIICEFDDNKTVKLGHSYRDIGHFLLSKGYSVFLSEYFPLERYGKSSKWRGIYKFPCDLTDQKGWGNFICLSRNINQQKFFNKLNGSSIKTIF